MKINSWFCNSSKMYFALMLLPFAAGTVLAGSILPAQADRTRECGNYSVVRDRSDVEAPILPRQSVAHCARSYQTLYQTYRVRRAPSDPNTSESNVQSDNQNLRQANPADTNSSTNTMPSASEAQPDSTQ